VNDAKRPRKGGVVGKIVGGEVVGDVGGSRDGSEEEVEFLFGEAVGGICVRGCGEIEPVVALLLREEGVVVVLGLDLDVGAEEGGRRYGKQGDELCYMIFVVWS